MLLKQTECTKLAPIFAANVLCILALLALTLNQLLELANEASLDADLIHAIRAIHPTGWAAASSARRPSDHWATALQTKTGSALAPSNSCGRWLEVNDSSEVMHPDTPGLNH